MDGAPELSRPGTERPVSRFNQQRVHFVGIAGCGMSGLAHVLLDAGATVTGTDLADDEVVADARLELRHLIREQSVSRTRHRYGNVVGS